jgi:hypothetical protein
MAETQPRKETTPNREIWVGEDFCPVQDYVLKPGENKILITFSRESLPPEQGRILFPQVAIRSRHAQSGLHDLQLGPLNELAPLPTGEQLVGSVIAFVGGGRPIIVTKETGLGKLFSTEETQVLHGPELEYYVREGLALTTDGQIGENISIAYDGIWVKLADEKYFIPEKKEPINLSNVSNYRHELDTNILQLAPPELALPFLVGETEPRIKPREGYCILLHRTVIIGGSPSGQQARSCLLEDKSPLWPIRVETVTKGAVVNSHGQPSWIKLRVARGCPSSRDSELPQLSDLRPAYL